MNIDPMDSQLISVERPFSVQNSSTDIRQHTLLTLSVSDIQNLTNNVGNVTTTDTISTKRNEKLWAKLRPFFGVCAFAIFTCIAMTIGVITVCLTSPKHTNQTCQLTFKRTPQHVLSYDSRPHDVAVGHLNQDNHPDIVVANSGTGNIGILMGYGNGTFQTQILYATGLDSRPYSVAVGDVNNDTLLDIIVANYGTNSVGVFLGDGNGSFGSQIITSLGSSRPFALVVGYFNNDTLLDIAVANYGTSNVMILLGSNDGSFRIDIFYDMGYDSIPYSLTVADFNQDNTLDLAVVNYGTSELVIVLRNKNASFQIHTYSTGSGSHPCSIATGDFNNDNISDIAVTNSDTSNVGIFLGDGNGTFTNQMTHSTGSSSRPQSLDVGDFNHDTLLDIVVIDLETNNVLILKGNGNGNFSIMTTHSTGNYSDPHSMVVGDFDNDGIPDVAIANNGTNSVLVLTSFSVYLSTTQAEYSTDTNSVPYSMEVADFNKDSYLDIVVVNYNTNNVGVFINLRNGTFRDQETYYMGDSSFPFYVVTGDLNNDYHLDIVVVLNGINKISILLGNGDGTFRNGSMYSTEEDSRPYTVAVGHLNNDSNLDIITSNYRSGTVGLFFGYGDGTFTNMTALLVEIDFYPICANVGDFNNDNISDIATIGYRKSSIAILLGYGNGSFQHPLLTSIDNDLPNYLIVGDLNSDQWSDIVYTDSLFSHVGVLLGSGNGSFGNSTKYQAARGSLPWYVALGYYNSDTLLDIAVSNTYDSSIYIFLGTNNGVFGAPIRLSTGYDSRPWPVMFADLDNDSQQELVVANDITDNILVFFVHNRTDFAKETSYLTGAAPHPYSVSIGDLNNDGQSDIVVAHSGNNNIELLLSYNQGIFTNKTFFSTGSGSHPQCVTTADFNKDHLLDIAVVNLWSDDMDVFVGLGHGSFDTKMVYSTGPRSSPNSIVTGDLNKDDRMDIVIANRDTDNVAVFLAFDYVTFIDYIIYVPDLLPVPYYVIADDFNKDDRLDIAVVNSQDGNFGIYLGYGNGTFSEQMSYSTGSLSIPVSLATGDFNNDNHLDIVVANANANNIGVFLGYGNGSFQPQLAYSTEDTLTPQSVATGDFNNDTRLDIVVANSNSDNIQVFLGDGNGSFTGEVVYSMLAKSDPMWVAVADLNNDTILDIVVANYYADNICILLGYGNGSFGSVIILSTGYNSGPWSIAIGDLNKDDSLDIVVANQQSKNISLFFGYSNGTFSSQKTYSTSSYSKLDFILVSDINNDTILDILVADYNTLNSSIGIFYGFGNGNFTLPKIYPTGLKSNPTSIAAGDFNSDRQIDLAISYSNQDSIGIMLQLKTEPFASSVLFPTGNQSHPKSVTVGDFNNDDHLDIAVANSGTNTIGIFLGHGDGYFNDQLISLTGTNSLPSSLAVGHFDDDDYLDIAVANSGSDNIGILFGCGNGTFVNVTMYSTGIRSVPSSIVSGDLNKDNHLDLVVTNSGTDNMLVFFGKGDGSFLASKRYSVDYSAQPESAAIGDINNDGLLDIVLANYGTDYVEIFFQTC